MCSLSSQGTPNVILSKKLGISTANRLEVWIQYSAAVLTRTSIRLPEPHPGVVFEQRDQSYQASLITLGIPVAEELL